MHTEPLDTVEPPALAHGPEEIVQFLKAERKKLARTL